MGLLDIDQVQADAILAMQLRTLTRMNRDKIVAEHEELQRKIADYIDILAKPERGTAGGKTGSAQTGPYLSLIHIWLLRTTSRLLLPSLVTGRPSARRRIWPKML